MKKHSTAFWMAWGMFCAIPCPCKRWDEKSRGWMLVYFPLVGLVIGAVWALLAWAFKKLGWTGCLSAVVLTALPFLLSGFLHLDGFMDCCDAILSRRELETRQKILKDSHVGSFAVICVCLLFLAEFAAFCDMTAPGWALLPLPAAVRAAAALFVRYRKPMQTSQYAGQYEQEKTKAQGVCMAALLALFTAVPVLVFGKAGCACVLGILGCGLSAWLASRNLGGMSGDVSGFAVTVGELCGLLYLAIL